jgi:hypothetical protein
VCGVWLLYPCLGVSLLACLTANVRQPWDSWHLDLNPDLLSFESTGSENSFHFQCSSLLTLIYATPSLTPTNNSSSSSQQSRNTTQQPAKSSAPLTQGRDQAQERSSFPRDRYSRRQSGIDARSIWFVLITWSTFGLARWLAQVALLYSTPTAFGCL